MAVTHPTAIRNLIADTVVDRLDLGTGQASGRLEIQTSGDVVVATLPMSNPAFGAAASGVATAGSITNDTNAVGGTAAKVVLKDRDGVAVIQGSVTATGGGGDLQLSTVTIPAAATVSVTSLTYTAPN